MNNGYLIVDTDIHPGVVSERMLDFMSEPWRTRFASGNRASGTLGYWNPGGVNRGDAVLEDGSRIEVSPVPWRQTRPIRRFAVPDFNGRVTSPV